MGTCHNPRALLKGLIFVVRDAQNRSCGAVIDDTLDVDHANYPTTTYLLLPLVTMLTKATGVWTFHLIQLNIVLDHSLLLGFIVCVLWM